ncbi:hypothetical protein [Pseudomonas soli]|uniref:hypothetical protein n=1 Tax=Pseudomonas soli TaxID=1306993 RepID=UPI003DA902A5
MPSLKKHLVSSLLALSAAVGGALLEASTDLLKKNFEPALISTRNTFEDWLSPLPAKALIGINLMFYMPSALVMRLVQKGFQRPSQPRSVARLIGTTSCV